MREVTHEKEELKPPSTRYQSRIIKWLAMVLVLVVALMVAGSSIQFLCWEGDVLTQELRSLVGARSVGWRPRLSALPTTYTSSSYHLSPLSHNTAGMRKINNEPSLSMLCDQYNLKILKPKWWNRNCDSSVFFQPPSLKTVPVAPIEVGKTCTLCVI